MNVVGGGRTEGRQGIGVLPACPGVWRVGPSALGPEGCVGVCLGEVSVCMLRLVCKLCLVRGHSRAELLASG